MKSGWMHVHALRLQRWLGDVREDRPRLHRVVGELDGLVGRQSFRVVVRDGKGWNHVGHPLERLPEKEGPVAPVRTVEGIQEGMPVVVALVVGHGSSCELLTEEVPPLSKTKEENVEMHHSFNPKWQRLRYFKC